VLNKYAERVGLTPHSTTASKSAASAPEPSFWNTVEEIKTNADGLLFWCFDEAAHLPDK
jgi:hypothetical protein